MRGAQAEHVAVRVIPIASPSRGDFCARSLLPGRDALYNTQEEPH